MHFHIVALCQAVLEAVVQHENPRRFKLPDEIGLHLAFAPAIAWAPFITPTICGR